MPCTFRVENVCNGNPETTVWCHSNEDRHGKGKGLKAHDCFGAWGCSSCHDWYDRGRDPSRPEVFAVAKDRTLYLLFQQRLIQVRST